MADLAVGLSADQIFLSLSEFLYQQVRRFFGAYIATRARPQLRSSDSTPLSSVARVWAARTTLPVMWRFNYESHRAH